MDIGAAAFWFMVAVAVAVNVWGKKHSETMRHETIRLMIEKGEKIDEAQLMRILNPAPSQAPEWLVPKGKPGEAYKHLRSWSVIILCIAVGLGMVALWRGMMLGFSDKSVLDIGTGIPLVAMLAAGLFLASRYVTPPPSSGNRDKQDS